MKIVRRGDRDFVPASHEDSARPGVYKKVLAVKEDLMAGGQVQMINWARLPAGPGFRRHYHEDMEEIFVILTGKAEIHIQDLKAEVEAGDMIHIAPGEAHSMRSLSEAPVEYLAIGIAGGRGGKTVVVPG